MEQYITLAGIATQTLLFLAGGYAMVIRNDSGAKYLKEELKSMKEELKELARIVTQQAVQSTQINNLNSQMTMLHRTVEDLRRGSGWIGARRNGIDGEYEG